MNDSSAPNALQMQMPLALLSLLHILINRLASLFRHIFQDAPVFHQLIEITVDRRDVDLPAALL